MLRIEDKVLHPELSYIVCGICFETHNELGRFRNEQQYADAVEYKLKARSIPCIREWRVPGSFQGERSGRNIVDFIIDGKIVLELKAKQILTKDDYFQIKRYLISCDKQLGILVNFHQKVLTPKRVLN